MTVSFSMSMPRDAKSDTGVKVKHGGPTRADQSWRAAWGAAPRLLRYYEEQGLLRPHRASSGYREYAEEDVDVVRHVRTLLAAGLSTTTIGEPPAWAPTASA